MRTVLTVGGSESAGVAGLAVDLRAFAALGVHGAMAVTAVTAQPEGGHQAVDETLLGAQIRAAGPVDAVKVGLLLGPGQARAILRCLEAESAPVVVDPVAGSSKGEAFAADEDWREGVFTLLPRTTVLTPNVPELEGLVGSRLEDRDAELCEAARSLLERGANVVLVKGGHRSQDPDDLLVTRDAVCSIDGEWIQGSFRGTGCLLASAVAALLARGRNLEAAVREAKSFVEQALRDARGERPHVLFEYYGNEGLP